jgi:hypothetical protein
MSKEADTIRKLVTLAASGDTPEARSAAAMARKKIIALNTELLDTLARQRARLLEELRDEDRRLISSRERATKIDTGALVGRAMMLFNHYVKIDALIPVVMLMRIEEGHTLTAAERQQLDGPVEDIFDQFARARAERRKAAREERKRSRASRTPSA